MLNSTSKRNVSKMSFLMMISITIHDHYNNNSYYYYCLYYKKLYPFRKRAVKSIIYLITTRLDRHFYIKSIIQYVYEDERREWIIEGTWRWLLSNAAPYQHLIFRYRIMRSSAHRSVSLSVGNHWYIIKKIIVNSGLL